MPRNVATPEQSARAQAEIGIKGKGFGDMGGENRIAGVRPLRKSDKRLLDSGEPEIYIYNVSPIFEWGAKSGGKSIGSILKRKAGAKVSEPLVIPGVMIRDFDAGNRYRQTYTELGKDIAEDVLGCSKEMPGLPQNDLTLRGCFYIIGKKFEELPQREQETILVEANARHEEKCRQMVLEADSFADSEVQRRWISEPYRLCAIFLAEEYGDKSMYERRWVSSRGGAQKKAVEECRWCGFEHKPGIVLCPNCKNILDQAKYDAMSKTGQKQQPSV